MQFVSRSRYECLNLRGRFRSLAAALLSITGCSSLGPSVADLPVGAIPLAVRSEFKTWFTKTQGCSGLRGQLEEIQWFVVPDAETFPTEAGPKVGMWEKSGRGARIVIAGRYANHEMVVRHEMLHHLLDREGHPPDFFVERCRLTWETWASANGDQ